MEGLDTLIPRVSWDLSQALKQVLWRGKLVRCFLWLIHRLHSILEAKQESTAHPRSRIEGNMTLVRLD